MAKKKEKSSEAGTASAPEVPATNSMMALFKPADVPTKLVRRNLPPMIKPGEVPMGSVVSGEIIKVVDSPVTTVKGKLLWLRHESGTEFLFPCTGVIRNALVPGKTEGKELTDALNAEVGKTFFAKRLPNKPSKYKKEMFMFDVFTSTE